MYRLHLKDQPPESGVSFNTREEAFAAQKAAGQQRTHKITFHPSSDDLEDWQYRERDKFRTGVYLRTPWHFDEAEYATTEWNADGTVERVVYPRFCHLSLDQKGMVAYTPTPEHGMQNRQVRVRPGRYLEQFLPQHRLQWATWIAAVSAFNGTLQIARTADDIESVYVHASGHSSCMTGTRASRRGDYTWSRCSQHPVRAYGDSDLGVAYLGTLGDRITARCVVWPDKHIYTRLYGDETLRELLKAHGYQAGCVAGARIRALKEGDGWLVPYIDGVAECRVVRDADSRVWLKLGEGSLDCQNTNGCTENPAGDEEETYTCSDCGNDVNGDSWVAEHDLCTDCYHNTYADCHQCGQPGEQSEMALIVVPGRFNTRERYFCMDHTVNCVECDDPFVPSFSVLASNYTLRESRQARNIHETVCPGCDDGTMRYCSTCERTYQPGDAPANCRECGITVADEPDDTDATTADLAF